VRVCRVYLGPDVACRLLQLLRRTGTQPGALTILAGTGTVMPFLFSTLPRPLPCGSGDRRRAAQRSLIQTPVPVPPGSPRFSRPRYLLQRATSADCSDGVLVAINVHGSEDQAKDASFCRSVRDHISVFSRPVHALRRVHADVVPFLSALWTSAVAGALPRGEETRSRHRTEPRSAFRR